MKNQSDLIKGMTDKEVISHLYLTQLILLVIASIIGFFLFDDFESFLEIWKFNLSDIIIYGGLTGIAVILIDLWLMKVLPGHLFDDGGINERVFRNLSIFQIFILSLIIATVEEWLFRGVIQTHFGLVVSSILFALLHVRYLKKWFLFIIVILLSFLLGWLYELTGNLFVPIFAHFMIDFVFGVKIRTEYQRNK